MFAVIRTGGKQYKVAAGDEIRVELLEGEPGSEIRLDEVLMIGEGETARVGTPTVEGASVAAEIVDQVRDKKVMIFKKRRRKNYRRRKGHRQHLTVLRIKDIEAATAA